MKRLLATLLLFSILLCIWIPSAYADSIHLADGDYTVGQDLPAGLYSVTAAVEKNIIATILVSEPSNGAVPKLELYKFSSDEPTSEVSLPDSATFSVKFGSMDFTLIEAYNSENTSSSEPSDFSLPSEPFDHAELLGNQDGYSFDKFDRKWKWSRAYVKEYTDAVVGVGIQVISADGGDHIQETDLFIRFLDAKTSEVFEPVTSVDFIIDEDVYSYKKMSVGNSSSMVSFGENGNLFIEAVAFCNPENVEMRIGTSNNSYEVDINPADFMWTLKDMCRTYLELHMWDYCSDKAQIAEYEKMFPLTINGQEANYETMHKSRDLSQIDATFTLPKPTPSPTPAPTPAPAQTTSSPAQVPQGTKQPSTPNTEINPDIPTGTSYELAQGEYEVGDDIPAGRYLIEWVSGNQYGGYINPIVGCTQFDNQVSIDPQYPYVAEVKNGDQFEVSLSTVRFTKITSLQNSSFRQSDGSYLLGPGYFYTDIDIPTGKYNVTAVGGNQYGIYVYVNGNMISLGQGETYNNLKLNSAGTVIEVSLGQAHFTPK